MSFIDGCACHVWAIDGWVNFPLASAVNTLYSREADRLYGKPLGDKGVRVGALVKAARQAQIVANHKAIFYGGWQNDTDSAPEHMWFVYKGYIYDTTPGAPLRRKAGGSDGWNSPPSARAYKPNMVGSWEGLLTNSQIRILETAKWDENNEYTPE
jgi:hypothetical protein